MLQVLGSSGAYYIVYFLFIIFFGSFYLINLVLAVVAISYEQEVLSPQEEKVILTRLFITTLYFSSIVNIIKENIIIENIMIADNLMNTPALMLLLKQTIR